MWDSLFFIHGVEITLKLFFLKLKKVGMKRIRTRIIGLQSGNPIHQTTDVTLSHFPLPGISFASRFPFPWSPDFPLALCLLSADFFSLLELWVTLLISSLLRAFIWREAAAFPRQISIVLVSVRSCVDRSSSRVLSSEMPKRRRSMSKSSRIQSQKPQVLAKLRKTETYSSIDSPDSWLRRLNWKHSKNSCVWPRKCWSYFTMHIAIFTFAKFHPVENTHDFNTNTVQ